MDNKEIVQKALNGEDIADLIKDKPEEEQTQIKLEISKEADRLSKENLEKLKGTSREVERRGGKKEDDEDPEKENQVLTQFRSEQVLKAKNRLINDPRFPLTEAEKSELDKVFSRIDSGKVDADLILEDYMAAYAVVKRTDLISAKEKTEKMEKDAAAFTSAGANASGGISQEDASKFSTAAQELFRSWQKAGLTGKNHTLERAEQVVSQGLSRRL